MKAIRSLVDAEEPKLKLAQSRLEPTGATQTANAASDVVQTIQQLDALDSAWTQARSVAFTALANGRPYDPVPDYDEQVANRLGDQISTQWDKLHGADACAS